MINNKAFYAKIGKLKYFANYQFVIYGTGHLYHQNYPAFGTSNPILAILLSLLDCRQQFYEANISKWWSLLLLSLKIETCAISFCHFQHGISFVGIILNLAKHKTKQKTQNKTLNKNTKHWYHWLLASVTQSVQNIFSETKSSLIVLSSRDYKLHFLEVGILELSQSLLLFQKCLSFILYSKGRNFISNLQTWVNWSQFNFVCVQTGGSKPQTLHCLYTFE